MVINKINFPIYGIIILLSLVIGIIYDYVYLKKRKVSKNDIKYFLLLIIPFALIGSISLSRLMGSDGLSSYAGAVALIIASIIYEKINPHKGIYLEVTILSLPLIYSIGKIACFIAGCCYGIPYNGVLSVTYTDGLNIPLFPIQLVESIFFMILFILLNLMNKEKKQNIVELTLISCAFLKFMLDFLRYDHVTKMITTNQIISIIFVIGTIIIMKLKKS